MNTLRRSLLLLLVILTVTVLVRATDGPLTPLFNLRGVTDANGYLRISAGTPGGVDTPLTPLSSLRGRTDGNGYLRVACSDCGSGSAPSDATYITQTANASLSAEQALGSLATGLLNVTTTTGVVSSFAPTDDNMLVGSGTVWALKALTSCSGASSAVTYNTSTNAFGCNTITAGLSGSISDTQVAFGTGVNTIGGSSVLTFASGALQYLDHITTLQTSGYVGNSNAVLLAADDSASAKDAFMAFLTIGYKNQLTFATAQGTADTPAPSTDGDTIVDIPFIGAMNPSALGTQAALISVQVDGAPVLNSLAVPGRIVFSTSSNSDANPVERMRIGATGTVSMSGIVTAAGVTISGLSTPTNKPVCFGASGNLYAGTNTAGVLSCP